MSVNPLNGASPHGTLPSPNNQNNRVSWIQTISKSAQNLFKFALSNTRSVAESSPASLSGTVLINSSNPNASGSVPHTFNTKYSLLTTLQGVFGGTPPPAPPPRTTAMEIHSKLLSNSASSGSITMEPIPTDTPEVSSSETLSAQAPMSPDNIVVQNSTPTDSTSTQNSIPTVDAVQNTDPVEDSTQTSSIDSAIEFLFAFQERSDVPMNNVERQDVQKPSVFEWISTKLRDFASAICQVASKLFSFFRGQTS